MNKLITIILFLISSFVTAYSKGGNAVIITMLVIIIFSVLVTLLAAVWYEGNLDKKIRNAWKITIPLTFAVFLSGYLFETLKAMF